LQRRCPHRRISFLGSCSGSASGLGSPVVWIGPHRACATRTYLPPHIFQVYIVPTKTTARSLNAQPAGKRIGEIHEPGVLF
jgi:hypothetical protein